MNDALAGSVCVPADGSRRAAGYWTIADPWRATTTIAGDTWFEYDAGAYRIDD